MSCYYVNLGTALDYAKEHRLKYIGFELIHRTFCADNKKAFVANKHIEYCKIASPCFENWAYECARYVP